MIKFILTSILSIFFVGHYYVSITILYIIYFIGKRTRVLDEAVLADSSAKNRKPEPTISSRAGITFPVGKCIRKLKKGNYANKISTTSGVYLAAVLEYLSAEVLELAGVAAAENNKCSITTRHIRLAVENDEELKQLFMDLIIAKKGC